MRLFSITAASFAIVIAGAPAAAAQQADVPFNGVILPTCTVIAGSPGTLVANPQADVLTSLDGISGSAAVTATGLGYEINVDPPFSFDQAPASGGTDTAFEATYQASGVTVAAQTNAGVPLTVLLGLTTLTIDATARRTSGTFPAGTYRLITTVRCIQP